MIHMPNTDGATRTLNLRTIFFEIFMYLAVPGFSCGMRDPVLQPGTEPGPSALGGGATGWWAESQPLTTREVSNLHTILTQNIYYEETNT